MAELEVDLYSGPQNLDQRPLVELAHPDLSIRRQCELLGINRAGLYYQPRGRAIPALRKNMSHWRTASGPDLAFDDDGEFQECRCADQAALRFMNNLRVLRGLRFGEENSGERRSVQDHLGRPRLS